MNDQRPSIDGVSESERGLLRRSVREFLAGLWPADKAVENAGNAEAIAALWSAMAGQGLCSLGAESAGVGLREIVLVFEELGRASCPAPLLGAVAANLALSGQPSNSAAALLEDIHNGKAIVAAALGAYDGDAAAGRVAVHGDRLHGTLAFVESVEAATHLAAFADAPAGIAIVAKDAPGVTLRETPGLAVPPLTEV